MSTPPILKLILLALALGLPVASTGFAAEEKEKEETVAFADVPKAVQKTIQAQVTANEATLGKVEKDTEDGQVVYEARLTLAKGRELEVEVANDGSLIKVEVADNDDKDSDDDDAKEAKKK